MTSNSDRARERESAKLLDALRNILTIEAGKGFPNEAVTGGLDRFLATLRGKAADIPALRVLADRGLLSVAYNDLSPAERERWARELGRLVAAPLPPPNLSLPGRDAQRAERALSPSPQEGGGSPRSGGERPSRGGDARRAERTAQRRRPLPSPPPQVEAAKPLLDLDAPAVRLRSVTSAHATKLARAGLSTVRDLLYLFPNRHLDYRRRRTVHQLAPGEEQTIIATIWEAQELLLHFGRRLRATQATVGDETGNVRAIWFGQPYLAAQFQRAAARGAAQIVLSGKVGVFNGRLQFQNPEWELLDDPESADLAELMHTGRIVPFYPSVGGGKAEGKGKKGKEQSPIPNRTMRRMIREALDARSVGDVLRIDDPLPEEHRSHADLPTLAWAVPQYHYPASEADKERARRRLAFDEFLTLQLAVGLKRGNAAHEPGIPLPPNPPATRAFIASLPFALTRGQENAIADAMRDVASGERPMNRLLQGDVGSGKTVVALALLLAAVAAERQGAMMAPTEVLAEQHFFNVRRLLGSLPWTVDNPDWLAVPLEGRDRPVVVGLLTGSTRARPRRELQQMAAEGTLDILVGTHALIQQGVELPDLALAVVDEQHRFGVLQRAALRGKGESPHLLLMSATPIPRTLALTVYGDLDVSTIAELPSGRKNIITSVVEPEEASRAEAFLVEQARQGRQSYVVCPLIDESEAVLARAATAEYERLRATSLSQVRVGLLHGRMPLAEKQAVMDEFRSGRTDVLVATPVIEVGVDVPNATVMMVLGASRFGLAQLHQLRGRVGRSEHQSYCFLLAESLPEGGRYDTEEAREEARKRLTAARERLNVLAGTNDGFVIAEEDLRLRGPGDFFGTRQSGLPALRMARLDDRELLAASRESAQSFLSEDPMLERHTALRDAVARFASAVTAESA